MHILVRLVINAIGLWAATRLVPGIAYTGEPILLLAVALIFGVLNAAVRPVLVLLTCPVIVLTLGLFTFVLNGLMLWLTSAISEALGLGFRVAGFWPAFLGALVISIISFVLSLFVRPERERYAD